MFKPILIINHFIAFLMLLILVSSSCTSTKNIPYFKDVPDTLKNKYIIGEIAYNEPKIKPNDLLQVSIQTIDPQANSLIGLSVTASMAPTMNSSTPNTSPNTNNMIGFLVDQGGFIELPLVGRVKVAGLSTSETQAAIRKNASEYYKDPVVNVRFANFTVTILGEVTKPGTYPVTNERITVLDAIGLAGDLTIFGKRGNILLVREENGQRIMARFDLRNTSLFQSPYFYLKQGDLLYIEPNRAKVASNDQAQIRNITIGSTIITSIALILSRFNF